MYTHFLLKKVRLFDIHHKVIDLLTPGSEEIFEAQAAMAFIDAILHQYFQFLFLQ